MTEVKEETIINESNFNEYFFDVRKHGPKRNQVMARFSAVAEFVDGQMKKDIINLLTKMDSGSHSAVKVMQKLGCATYQDAIDVCLKMAEDLKEGLSKEDLSLDEVKDEVEKKVYPYHYEQFFYAEEQNVPKDNPHWAIIQIANLEDHLEKVEGGGEIQSKFLD